jgi:hypothetical protein
MTLNAWDKIVKNIGISNVYLLFDNTKSNMTDTFLKQYKNNIILVTDQKCKDKNPFFKNQVITCEFGLIIAYDYLKQQNKLFDYIWLIENDVYCDGNYLECFNISNEPNDFLATYVADYSEENKDWVHWKSIEGEIAPLDLSQRVKSFFPITRYSIKLLDSLKENLGKSSGFCEVYIPTLAKYNNLTYGNVNPKMIGEFQFYKIIDNKNIPNNNDNRLWHKYVYE